MSIHTFEVRKRVKLGHFDITKDRLFEYCKKNNVRIYRDKDREDSGPENSTNMIWVCDALKHVGIRIELVQHIVYENPTDELNSYFDVKAWYNGIHYIINPRRVINDNEYVGIFNTDNTNEMIEKSNSEIRKITYMLPILDEMILTRLDFCQNVHLGTQDLVEIYMKMVKRCRIPKGFKMDMYKDEMIRKWIYPKNGVKLSKKSLTISIYNKKAQLENEMPYFQNIRDAEGIIRFEIQAKYHKLFNLKSKKGKKALRDFLNDCRSISSEQFEYYIPKLFGEGDFYSIKRGIEIIEQSEYSDAIKESMIAMMRLTSTRKSLDKAISEMIENGYSEKQIPNLLKKFDALELSPCTLPRRWEFENALPNPIKLIRLEFAKKVTSTE